ncbi:regulator of drug sensitivity 2 [Aspergillus udagawae]|nr:regulator of drug sensitivity 2 [Aspergillus udagawae]GFG17909.1 regulator of drug sensitivity 2 [Aspergillus udagawae]
MILLSQLLESEDRDNASSIAHLISTFEEALKHANSEGRLPLYSASELDFFATKSYNVALDIRRSSLSEPVLHLLDISLKFTELYHKKTGFKDRAFMYLLSEYVKSNKLIAEARGRAPSSAKAYEQIRQSVQRFETHIKTQLDTCNTVPEREAWMHKHRFLIALDFEAAINLKQWNEIPDIIERANKILDDHLCSVFLDCILRSGAPAPDTAQVVKVKRPRPASVVNLTKAQDIICIFHFSPSPSFSAGAFHQKLPRYLRCLFQIAVEAKDYSLAESVLQQAIVLVRDGSADADVVFIYPSDELKWLATMAFNRAVDLYLASADEVCRKWGEIAFTLAGFVKDDGGALLRMLRQNYAKLM